MFIASRWARMGASALVAVLAACGANGGGGDDDPCLGAPASVACPRTLAGTLDTAVAVAEGAPYGAGASLGGIAYITLHGSTDALGKWDFAARTYQNAAVVVGDEPTNVVFAPNGATAYVASQLSDRVDVVTVSGGALNSASTPGNNPYQTAVLPNGSRFYASGNADKIWVFNAANRTLIDTVHVSAAPNGMAITADGTKMFVTHLSSGVIGVVTLATHAYDTLTTVGDTPVHGIAVSEDGSKLYVVSQGTDSLYMFDTGSGANLGQAYAGNGPFGLALTPDGTEVWVTTLSGELRRYAQGTLVPGPILALSGTLRRIAIDPAGRGAVIADEGGRVLVVK